MTVNGITNSTETYSSYKPAEKPVQPADKGAENITTAAEESGVVYEPTLKMPTQTYKANQEVINRLKLDAQNRLEQLQNIVRQLISKQADTAGNATDIWSFLREGNYTVDPETKAQAQADIAEDGYWGVNQTSDRIIDFAMALTGGDPSKVEEMREAFKKGYEQAEKTWGGELPDISKQTYEAVMKKFDDLAGQSQN